MRNAKRNHRRCGAIFAAISMMLAAFTVPAQAQTYTVLYSLTGGADGGLPTAAVVRDAAGNLYGTTEKGGDMSCPFGCGVVFKLDAIGDETVLYSFTGGPDGSFPRPGVVRDAAGNLYGSTYFGGAYGCGVVFKLDASGRETVLYAFTGGADGSTPGQVWAAGAKLYGAAAGGGDVLCLAPSGCGTLFKVDKTRRETLLYTFEGGTDGASPIAVTGDAAGNLYGTTESGGVTSCNGGGGYGCGTVFKLDASGTETILHAFAGGADGAFPNSSGVIRDAAGNLYGTTYFGGASNSGTVFKVDPASNEAVLYSFTGGTDGGLPVSGVIRDGAGNLYGTTSSGGETSCNSGYGFGCGTVFRLDTTGHERVLHSFTGTDGVYPWGTVILDAKGNLYGTTPNGGAYNYGVVFKIGRN
jgi:uncharacterized repeat protein (TIGR03803 family)